ncbi:MAG: polysaccharide pyruvyl transferase family protein [Ruminococcus flavefaciens]
MKEVALITVNRTLNYGTMLQMYACVKLFENRGYHTTIIDYYRENDYQERDFESILQFCKKKNSIDNNQKVLRKALGTIKACVLYKDTKSFYQICRDFISKHFSVSPPCYSLKELKQNIVDADCFCAGSDQIWNTDYNGKVDPAYFLAFVGNDCKKIAFSSSIGKDALSDSEKKEFYKYLKGYYAISVRERVAKEMLSAINLPVTALIDPTLMIHQTEWLTLASKRIISKPYLLLYKLKGDDLIDHIAEKIASSLGLQLVRITFSKLAGKKSDTTVVLPDIPRFLSLIYHADYVVTNSFHGTCFSINFGKQFTAVPRHRYNSRILNILSVFQLDSRYCSSLDAVDTQLAAIDYAGVNAILSKERADGNQWLDQALC